MSTIIQITDHSLVRWMERVHGVPMEQFRAELFEIVRGALDAGADSIRVAGFDYRFRDGVLVTVIDCRASNTLRRKTLREKRQRQERDRADA